MKTLVVYYSFEGNTEFIARVIAEVLQADVVQIKPTREIGTRGFGKYFWGGKQAFMKHKPELVPFEKDFSCYDTVLIGTPVWAWSYAPPLATFFSSVTITGKDIGVFCCHAGGKGKTLEKMRGCLPGNRIVGQIDFIEPLWRNKERNAQKAQQWARETFVRRHVE